MRLQDARCSLVVTHKLKGQLEQLKALGANPCCDCVRCQKAIRDCNCAACSKRKTTAAESPAQ